MHVRGQLRLLGRRVRRDAARLLVVAACGPSPNPEAVLVVCELARTRLLVNTPLHFCRLLGYELRLHLDHLSLRVAEAFGLREVGAFRGHVRWLAEALHRNGHVRLLKGCRESLRTCSVHDAPVLLGRRRHLHGSIVWLLGHTSRGGALLAAARVDNLQVGVREGRLVRLGAIGRGRLDAQGVRIALEVAVRLEVEYPVGHLGGVGDVADLWQFHFCQLIQIWFLQGGRLPARLNLHLDALLLLWRLLLVHDRGPILGQAWLRGHWRPL